MNTETLTVLQKGEDFEIIVQHDQTGSAYGINLSKNAYEQLRQHFVVGRSESFVCDCGNSSMTWYGNDDDKKWFCFNCKKEANE